MIIKLDAKIGYYKNDDKSIFFGYFYKLKSVCSCIVERNAHHFDNASNINKCCSRIILKS